MIAKDKKPHTIDDLNKHYKQAEEADSELFAEMRSNLLLEAGNQYSKKLQSGIFNQIRNSVRLSEAQKLRIVKNHLQKITKTYKNAILEKMPGVSVVPHNELDMQDKKAAELNQGVWEDMQERYGLHEHRKEGVSNFVTMGERCSFVYYDDQYGAIKGYEQMLTPEGVPAFDQMGNPVPDESKPVYEGVLCFKNIPAYNLLRALNAKSMKSSPYLIIREMMDVKELAAAYENEPDKLAKVKGSSDEEFVVFDSNKKSYQEGKEEILIRYHFFRPCARYPDGYFFVCVKGGILEEGALPYGIFPVLTAGFDRLPDNPRSVSIIRVARPYQAEINRASSQMATHQVTLGDDKILYQGGTKLSPGALLPGV